MNYLTCLDTNSPNFLFFDTTIAPPLLFYSYIPIVILFFFVSLFVLFKNRHSLVNKLFFIVSVFFAALIINELNTWIAVPVGVLLFSWQLVILIEVSIFVFFVYFVYAFVYKKDISFLSKIVLFLIITVPALLLNSKFNILGFDIYGCEGSYGSLLSYNYIIQIASVCFVALMTFDILFVNKKKLINRTQSIIVSLGALLFLINYILLSLYGELTLLYEVNLISPIGMLVFLSVIGYVIVKYNAFRIKLLAPQALVFALIFLNFAMLFIRRIENIRIVIILTIIISSILGFIMIRAVKKVDQQRIALDIANKQQTNLLHFISHQVKGFFTKSRNAFSGLLEGDYGPIPETARHIIQEGFDSDNRGVETVQQILNAANLKTGKTTYVMSETNFVNVIKDIILSLKPAADKKSLTINFNPPTQNLIMNLDTAQITQALKNLIDNSIKYTPSGKIDITLEVQEKDVSNKKVVIKISDTGVGISTEDMPKLFSEGGRGKEAIKINVDSTGYGLYIVKNIIEAHGGSVTVHSDGVGKGSTFTVVLPVK